MRNSNKKKDDDFLPDGIVSITAMTTNEFLKEHGRESKLYQCYLKKSWKKAPVTNVLVIRQTPHFYVCVFFTVDKFCRGIINTKCYACEQKGIKMLLDDCEKRKVPYVPCKPDLAFSLIYGSWHFAEKCGLEPHPDFEYTQYALPPESEVKWVKIDLGGREGRPLYMAGPDDDDHKITMTMRKLTAKLGEDGFDYYFPYTKTDYALKKSIEFIDKSSDNIVIRLLGLQTMMSEILPESFQEVLGDVPDHIGPDEAELIVKEVERQAFMKVLLTKGVRPGEDFNKELREFTLMMVQTFNKKIKKR